MFDLNFFRPKICGPIISWTQNVFELEFFGPKFVLDPNCFGLTFLGSNFFGFKKNVQDKSQAEQSYYLSSFLISMDDSEKLKILMMFYEELELYDQCLLLAFIGDSLNQSIYEASSKNIKHASTLKLDDLKIAKKSDFHD